MGMGVATAVEVATDQQGGLVGDEEVGGVVVGVAGAQAGAVEDRFVGPRDMLGGTKAFGMAASLGTSGND